MFDPCLLNYQLNSRYLNSENKVKAETAEDKKIRDVIKIQSFWRGCLARSECATRHPHLLSYPLFKRAKPYINDFDLLKNLQRPLRGRTRAYFPNNLPLILKESGSPANVKRLEKMHQAREICQRNGYQHLIIPRARIYKNFIIESRLPIHLYASEDHMRFYAEYHACFNQAVREFLGFLSQSYFSDILSNQGPFQELSQVPQGRYDNIALYIEGDKGRIGLIDLEHFSPSFNKAYRLDFSTYETAILLFPYHFEEIMDEAIKRNPEMKCHQQALSQKRDEALKRFKVAYDDHLNFIKEKNITFTDPIAFEEIESATLERIKEGINCELRKWDKDNQIFNVFQGCLGEDPDQILTDFNAQAFPILMKETEQLIKDCLLENKLENEKEEEISSHFQLLSMRTMHFEAYGLQKDDKFIDELSAHLKMMNLNERDAWGFPLKLLKTTLKEMERARVISYYHFDTDYNEFHLLC